MCQDTRNKNKAGALTVVKPSTAPQQPLPATEANGAASENTGGVLTKNFHIYLFSFKPPRRKRVIPQTVCCQNELSRQERKYRTSALQLTSVHTESAGHTARNVVF